ncbi:O-antigen ligase family protein [Bacillus paramycoides]|uniref:O-antigen ligase family protein n=1 Tax=Bacillus paramycoides TaxID=2026194 RepID=UPI002E214F2A|nr:O-antigen ligase family protein [Bacillus paramycoides]
MIKEKTIRINLEKQEVPLAIFLLLYVIVTSILGFYHGLDNFSIYKVLFNNIYIFTFLLILIDSKWDSKFTMQFAKIFGYSFIVMGIIGIILYFLGFYAVKLTFTFPFFKVYDENDMLNFFGEIRFQSIFSHKTKYAFYCLMGMYILRINSAVSKRVKGIGILILIINIILTNSITALISMIIVLATFIDYKKVNIYLRYIFLGFVGIGIIIGAIYIYDYTSEVRNLDTLGSRSIIWESAIEFLKEHPMGVIDNWYFYRLNNHFQGAHNVFLNEFLDYGFIGGLLFPIIYVFYFYSLFKIEKRILGIFIAITMLCMIDNILYYDIVPVFWLFYLVIKIMVRNNRTALNRGNLVKGD